MNNCGTIRVTYREDFVAIIAALVREGIQFRSYQATSFDGWFIELTGGF